MASRLRHGAVAPMVLAGVAGALAWAGAVRATPPLDCTQQQGPQELLQCANQRLAAAEAELAQVLAKARERIARIKLAKAADRDRWRAALEDSHKGWTALREVECRTLLPLEWQGAAGTDVAVIECLAQMAETRVFELGERYGEGR